jgi:ATP-dependent helicase HrpA
VAQQRAGLVADGFVRDAGVDRLPDVARYLRAAAHRLDALPDRTERDRAAMAVAHRAERAYGELVDEVGTGGRADVELERIGWMLEELRVGLFAQHLGTTSPVSEQRVAKAIARLRAR